MGWAQVGAGAAAALVGRLQASPHASRFLALRVFIPNSRAAMRLLVLTLLVAGFGVGWVGVGGGGVGWVAGGSGVGCR